MSLYFESHVTIEPVFDERLEHLKKVCRSESFHVADLLMKKRANDSTDRSQYDTFCTGRAPTLEVLRGRMFNLLGKLNEEGFKVWRYKIEEALLDSKVDDQVYPLK